MNIRMYEPDAVDVIIQFIPKFVEFGIGEEECVEGQRYEHFTDHLDAESGNGQQPGAHQMRRPEQGKAAQSHYRQHSVNGQGPQVSTVIRIRTAKNSQHFIRINQISIDMGLPGGQRHEDGIDSVVHKMQETGNQ